MGGIEFRCSLKLSGGKSLANVGKDLVSHDVKKMVGDLDYELIRTPLTPLTELEKGYCENDIRVLLAYIAEKIESDGDITKIPLTNTGYVREYCRQKCFARYKPYRALMEDLTMQPNEFKQLHQAFMGGHTHANAHYVQKVLTNVASYDFISSYPAVMLLEKFPMSKATSVDGTVSDEKFSNLLLTKAVVFDLVLTGVRPRIHNEHPISKSKCWLLENAMTDETDYNTPRIDNGRVVMADKLGITVTEQDFITYSRYYYYDAIDVYNIRYYDKKYLPHQFAKAILGLYERKTKLKDVKGEEVNYAISKNMMNAAYGMIVTNPVRDEFEYVFGECKKSKPDIESAIAEYNRQVRRFLYYPWGVWVTAYARRNLFTGIEAVGDDFVYSDTDSIKLLNHEKHRQYFENYDKRILEKIERAAEYHNVKVEQFRPRNKKGVEKTIGVWDFEGVYDEFKTLGAKRYMYRIGDKYQLTLAGANKSKSMEYLYSTGDPFGRFDNNLVIPPDNAGRLTITYIDEPVNGTVVDYRGVPYKYNERTCAHMEKSQYNLTMSDDFINYLKGVQDIGE